MPDKTLPGLGSSRSLPSIPWVPPDDFARIHHDQSHLGRPIDPEVVARVRHSLNMYQGPRSMADTMDIVIARADEKQRKFKALNDEYAVYIQKVKDEAQPVFKFDTDPRKGMPTQEEYIKARVKKGLREIGETTSNYNTWIEGLRAKMEYKRREQLQAKLRADEEFANAGASREEERKQRDAAIQENVRLTQAEYWKWLREMKEEVDMRPNSAPAAVASGAESASAAEDKKRRERIAEFKKNSSEYMDWAQTLDNGVFELPYHPVVDAEEHQRRIDAKSIKVKEFNKESAAYFDRVREMERKHHGRIMRVVTKRLEADKQFNRSRDEAASQLELKMEEHRQKELEQSLNSRQELKDMYQRVRDKPMFLELAYKTK